MCAPPDSLRDELVARGVVAAAAGWSPQRAGRTNRVWRVDGAPPLAVKLYGTAALSPLFPNDPGAEWRALSHLRGTGLAPDPVACRLSPPAYLVYRYMPGRTPVLQAPEICRALRRLHDVPPPAGLRRVGEAETFLHGDPVPGNAVATEDGLCFIDWQCPASGDPLHDLMLALSPSMRLAHGLAPLEAGETDAALAAYGSPEVTAWFHARRADYARRLADHAAWRIAQGDAAYGPGLRAERALADRRG